MAFLACFLDSFLRREPDIRDNVFSHFLIHPRENDSNRFLSFRRNHKIEYAIFKKGTKEINSWMFNYCSNLKFVFLP
jgi:hypothetical protein